jgi:hypothetical protein
MKVVSKNNEKTPPKMNRKMREVSKNNEKKPLKLKKK